jgi:hypothetical protein
MNRHYLSHVTLETLENCRSAARQGVVACRSGGRRLVAAVNGALEQRVYPRTAQVAPRATRFANGLRGNVTQIVVKGLDETAARAATAIESGAHGAGVQVHRLAKFASTTDNAALANGLQAVARLTMPGARLALAISGQVAAGARALADAAGARPVRRAPRRAVALPRQAPKRAARKATKTAAAKPRRSAKKAVARSARG